MTTTLALTVRCRHRWALEPTPYTKPSPFKDRDIDGELYTERYTRGNIRGTCKTCRTPRTFHPFTGGLSLTGNYSPVGEPMLSISDSRPATLA